MKALILSGGKGTRLYPITYTSAKQLVPVANKPILFYAIEAIVAAGIREIGIVVGDTHEEVKGAVGNGQSFGSDVCIHYIHQDAPLGLAHAVKIARFFLGTERFVMFLGDNFIEEPLSPLIEQFTAPDNTAHAQIFLAPVPNPSDFGVAFLYDQDGQLVTGPFCPSSRVRVVCLVEKPAESESNLALVGIYFFDSHIFEAVDAIKPSKRGELEITDAIQYLIDHQYQVFPHVLTGYWIDTGKMRDLLAANRVVLSRMDKLIAENAFIDETSSLSGEVIIEDSAQVINSVLRGPCIVGRHATISHAYIGPFTSIDHHSTVINCEIEHSIVMESGNICNIPGRIEDSLIGRYVHIQSSSAKPHTFKLLLGDHSKIELV